jgi:hypothetical protein
LALRRRSALEILEQLPRFGELIGSETGGNDISILLGRLIAVRSRQRQPSVGLDFVLGHTPLPIGID